MKHEAVADFHNRIQDKFGDDYESKRWRKSPVTRSHLRMATDAITRVLHGKRYASCIELGPGAGTWTKVLIGINPDAQYTLVDISDTMLSIARENLKGLTQVSDFRVSDFLALEVTQTYDFFFSSRALEYIVDKTAAVEKINALLTERGEGLLITKNPRYWADRLFGREVPELHRNQITPGALKTLLIHAGFTIESIQPVTVTVPFFKSALLNDCAYAILRRWWIPFIHPIFAESYLIYFRRP